MILPYIYHSSYAYLLYAWLQEEVLWTKQLEFYVSQLGFNVRSAYAYCGPLFVEDNIDRGIRAGNLINDIVVRAAGLIVSSSRVMLLTCVSTWLPLQKDVMYGQDSNPDRIVRPGLQVSKAFFDLMMNDGKTDACAM